MKKVIITGGPTNEYIDEVMKITNMSTGSLSVTLGQLFEGAGHKVCLIVNNSVNTKGLEKKTNVKIIKVETTEEMLEALLAESKKDKADCVIHAAAVGDYKGDFSFLMEDLAKELFEKIDQLKSPADILKILTDPNCKINDDSKISSYQKNLTVKLDLTPKIIGNLRSWYPEAVLIGCKLLENVTKEELFETSRKLAEKNKMDYILANDLAELRKGITARHPVTIKGYVGKSLEEPKDIFEFVVGKL